MSRFDFGRSGHFNNMKISEYPYGKVTKTLKKAVNWLNTNKKLVKSKQKDCYEFDYPDYWGMPKSISYRLSSSEVDWIQSEAHTFM